MRSVWGVAMGNVETVRGLYEAFNRRDYEAAVSVIGENAVLTDHGRDQTFKGPEQAKASLQEWAKAFSDGKVTVERAYDAGDTVIVEFRGTGTNDGPMGPMPATGKRVDVPFCDVWQFGPDGKVIRNDTYFNLYSMMVQMGLAEPPPAQ